MSNSGKMKKKVNRLPSKKNFAQNQMPPFEGAYSNPRLVHVLLSLMGTKCRTKVRNGFVYEGIFHTFNQKMDLAVNAAHLCDNPDQSLSSNGVDGQGFENGFPKEKELIHEMKFPSENFVSAHFENVDMDYATLEVNERNGDLTNLQRNSAKGGEKKLEPWNGGGDSADADPLTIGGLESSSLEGTNGWDANEMFKANEEKYGVVSDYDSSLPTYTMQLNMKGTEEDSARVARAARIAQEIESGTDYKYRNDLELDDGITEEDKFSAVPRERDQRRDGRGPRDMRDRDGDYGGHRGDKDRGDRDHPSSPQGFRAGKNSDFEQRPRNRGRGRDSWSRNSGYPNQNMASRPTGMGGGPSGTGRNQSMSQMDGGPQGQGGQGKPYRASSTNLPPRFSKSGSQGHSRDDDRVRPASDSGPLHSYQTAKGPRNQRMPRTNNRHWQPTSPSSDYPHHNPQMDPAVISSGGGPSLSRTSSSSSNTSVPVQNHRKHLSTSSQDDQPQNLGQHHPHIRQSRPSSSPTGGPVIPGVQQQPSSRPQPGGPNHQEGQPSWAAIARGPQKDVMQTQIGPHTIPLGGVPDAKYSWGPSQSQVRSYQAMPPRVLPNPAMQQQMIRTQQSVVSPPQQRQASPAQQPVMHQQKSSAQTNSRAAQPPARTQPTVSQDSTQQADKTEDTKIVSKKAVPVAQNVPVKNRNDGPIKELQEFGHNFKLSTDVNKDSPPAVIKPLQRPQPSNVGQQQQPSPSAQRIQSHPQVQQQGVPHQAQPHSVFTAPMGHQEHGMPAQHAMGQSPVQMTANQGTPPLPKPHQPQSVIPHLQHSQTVVHPNMSQQIPMASPGIQQFASSAPPQGSPRPLDNRRMIPSVDKAAVAMQKPLPSPTTDVPNFNMNGNVHVVTGKPVLQSTPSAVISVSAAAPSPLIISSQYQATATANSQPSQQSVKQSSNVQAAVSSPSSTPAVEHTSQPPVGAISTNSLTSPTAGRPLNPEASEFKPRAPATAPVPARPSTPLQHGYVAYPTQVIPPPPSQLVYTPGQVQPIDAMYQQHLFIAPPVVQQMSGQQMQPFAAFDQGGQVYPSHTTQPMISQNARMALPGTPQAHVQPYPPDQSPGAVYAMSVQQSAYMQQARPHSAHTPTKVTAASPAGQAAQQTPQQAGQAQQAMVQGPGGQQSVWMMVPPPHVGQPSTPFMGVVPTPMPSTVAPQKMTQQPIQYMPQHPSRAPYAQFQPPAPSNQ